MSDNPLYRMPTVLDTVRHRQLKLKAINDYSMASGLHASFLAVTEFPVATHEFVIVFVRDPGNGNAANPIAVLGTMAGENLYLDGKRWDGRYVPAYIRRYPFWTVQLEAPANPAVVIDAGWEGFSETEGEALYEADGKPAPRLALAIDFIERFEVEAARTQAFCARLVELDLLREMSANLTLPGGNAVSLDGFFVVDEAKLQALPDATVVEMHRNGMLGLLNAHLLSLSNMQTLVERKAARLAAKPSA